ncbi:MAG: beta-N-acetylhexosaminidase, partial [Rubrivivax sp.]|nr:beta-N-acetylhexosaminidase [Rubrivivax sp.]
LNWNFAPVLDVNSNPANPVIGERSFGADPARVARLAGAWLRGSAAQGVACCVKHFPGHGDTHTDSHHALPVVDKSLAELEAVELAPFRALAAQAPSLMTAHIVYPQLDPERPATLSPRLLAQLLRQDIGYRGVVITDALMMKAVHDRWGTARAAVMALQAGADMPLAQGTRDEQRAALAAIAQAQAEGTLNAAALAASAARLDHLAATHPATPVDLGEAQRAADAALMDGGWRRALCALGGARPPAPGTPLRVVTQARVPTDGVSEAGVGADAVRALFAGFVDVQFDEVDDLAGIAPDRLQARDGRRVVLVSTPRERYRAAAAPRRPDLHLALWNPFHAMDIAAPALVTWGHAPGALAAARSWLHGQATATATAPVPLEIARP